MSPWLRAIAPIVCLSLLTSCDQPHEIVLASTTSTEDSGLFEVLLPEFVAEHPRYRVRVIAVGSGEALRLARRGDADVVLVHSPAAEEEFMDGGHGESRRSVMVNDFVIVGPPSDPAGLAGTTDAAAGVARIAATKETFISRGDDSGTHARERGLWRRAAIEPGGEWYLEAGQGMGQVLMMASEKGGYTLADRGTFLSLQDRLHLRVVVEGDPLLVNPYSVIVVRDAANLRGARQFADWITGREAQALIGEFGTERFGRPLFTPTSESS